MEEERMEAMKAPSAEALRANELEQALSLLIDQAELLSQLEDKLASVSESSPAEPTTESSDRFHISAVTERVRRNNMVLRRIRDSLLI